MERITENGEHSQRFSSESRTGSNKCVVRESVWTNVVWESVFGQVGCGRVCFGEGISEMFVEKMVGTEKIEINPLIEIN